MQTKSALRLAVLPVAVFLSLASIPSDRAPRALRTPDAVAAVEPKDRSSDLASLVVFRRAIVQIKDNYVDPSRINPKEMFTSALEAVERQVAEVMVEVGGPACSDQGPRREPGTSASTPAPDCGHANSSLAEGKVRVTVGSAAREFDYRDIDTVWQIPLKMHAVFGFMKENLVTQTDQREIEYAAINGMLSTLDPHSWLLKPDVYKEMKVQTRGEFGGLGFVISMIDDRLTVRKVLKNTPAWRAGIKKGDVITQIDADSTVSMELQEAVDRMRGKPGTLFSIIVQHKGQDARKLDLVRATVTYETVTSKLLDNGIGYVRLSGFSGTTTRDMQASIRAMKQQNGGTLRGLILDVRGNPGGLLEQAIQVSDAFVEEGTIVTTVGMNGQLREPKLARNDGGERDEEEAKASRDRTSQKPGESLRFVKEETAKERKAREAIEAGQAPEEDDSDDPTDDDGVTLDYQIEFCRDMLAQAATSTNRLEQLKQMKPFVEQRRAQEQEKVRKALEAMGLNWAKAPQAAAAPPAPAVQQLGQVRVTAELRAPRTQAGDTMDLAVTAHNNGTAPIYRLRAYTKSDNGILDRREFVFGQLQPHEKRTWTVPVKVPRYMPSRKDDVTVKFEDDQADAIEDVRGEGDIQELPRPSFAWSWQLTGSSSPDGLLHKGEQVELVLDVKNIGQGKAYDAFAALKNLSEEKLNVKKGRTKLGPIAPGETRTAIFILEPKKGLEDAPVTVRLELGDKETWEIEKEKLLLPVGALVPASPSVAAVRVQADTNVLSAALETADKLASVKKGAVLAAKGKVGSCYRVEWQKR